MPDVNADFSNKGISHLSQIEIDLRVTNLNLSNNPIVSLKGLGRYKGLLYLSAADAELTQIRDLGEAPQLKLLAVNNNKIQTLEGLEDVVDLEMLYASYSEIKSIEQLSNHEHLIEAYLAENRITEIPHLTGLGKLKTLYLDDNMITSIKGLERLDGLKYLNLSGNPVGNKGLEQILRYKQERKLPKLKKLVVEECGIDWSSKRVQEVVGKLKEYDIDVENARKYLNLHIPGYRKIDKVGEGGTFDVFLIQKIRQRQVKTAEYLEGFGLPLHLEVGDHDTFLMELVKMTDKGLETVADVENNIGSLSKIWGMGELLYNIYSKNPEFVYLPDPLDEYSCLLFPKKIGHQQRNVNYHGYCATKEVGAGLLLTRGLDIHRILDGLKGIPKLHEEIDVEVKEAYDSARNIRCLREEYIKGHTLDSFLSEHKKGIKGICSYVAKTLEILQGIHERGVMHNDISPNNILVNNEGEVYIIDYALSSIGKLELMGYASRRFSSPELLHGKQEISPASDVWSVSVMMYYLLKGTHPISDDSAKVVGIISDKKKYQEAKARIDFQGIPEGIKDIIEKCMSYDSSQRYQTARETADSLRAVVEKI